MKEYVKPSMEIVNLRVEERIAGSCLNVGSCLDELGNLTTAND